MSVRYWERSRVSRVKAMQYVIAKGAVKWQDLGTH